MDSNVDLLQQMLIYSLPTLLVQLGALIVALCLLGRYRLPALLLVVAVLVAWTLLLVRPFVDRWIIDASFEGDLDPEAVERWLQVVGFVSSCGYAFVWGLLVWAVFAGRGRPAGVPPAVAATPATLAPAATVKPISKGLFLGSIIGGAVLGTLLASTGLLLMTTARSYDEDQILFGAVLSVASFAPLVFTTVMLCVLIYRLWAAIQGHARTTPGLAVGLLFVPLFNFYWLFQVYWGWAVDYNRFASARGQGDPPVSQGMALFLCVSILLSVIPVVGILFGLLNLILLPLYLNQAITAVNHLALQERSASDLA